MRTLTSLLFVALFMSCQSNSTPEKAETPSTLKTKTVSLDDSTFTSIGLVLSSYEALRDSLIEYNSVAVDTAAHHLVADLSNVNTTGIKDAYLRDSLTAYVSKMKELAVAIPTKASLDEKKRNFSGISDAFYALLSAVQYHSGVIYKQTCPMAFNESESASWISRSAEVNNPYLGKKHVKYASGMLHCGEVTDSVAYKK